MKFHKCTALYFLSAVLSANTAVADTSTMGVALNPYTSALTLNRLARGKGNSEEPDHFVSIELSFPIRQHRYEIAIPILYRENRDLQRNPGAIWVANTNRVASADIALRRHFPLRPDSSFYLGPFARFTRVYATTEAAIKADGAEARADDLSRVGGGFTIGYKRYLHKRGLKGAFWGINVYLGAYTDGIKASDGYIDNYMWSSFDRHTRTWIGDIEFFKFGYEF